MKFRITCDRINCKWNLGKIGVFKHQCKKPEVVLINGKCVNFKIRDMPYEEPIKKGLEHWI